MKVSSDKTMIVAYTDGACSRSTGGSGYVLVNAATGQRLLDGAFGPFTDTTNNQMEMMSVIYAMRAVRLHTGLRPLTIVSDSKYVINGITDWIHNWKKNCWLTASNKPVLNSDLWKALDAERSVFPLVHFEWVKGHDGNEFNERADRLAVGARNRETRLLRLNQAAQRDNSIAAQKQHQMSITPEILRGTA